jgi:hypothetical protein
MPESNVIENEVTQTEDTLPEANVEVLDGEGIRIQLERLSSDSLYDQGIATASGQGCISSPNGQSC